MMLVSKTTLLPNRSKVCPMNQPKNILDIWYDDAETPMRKAVAPSSLKYMDKNESDMLKPRFIRKLIPNNAKKIL
jgi:hypothetical protein